ncbi:MAG TPA: phosphate signaling complex protein PhoU [Candidatus Binataceae bacterium]|nr:phosphate signaling complex protein PhoU [Candidatus Binataceae bacterium]
MPEPQPQHTNRQYEEELRALRTRLLKMGGMVERQITDAVESMVSRNSDEAREVIALDAEVNRMDIDIEAMCVRLLALRQPAAGDLRFITTGLKIDYDLERIGDLAVNICERTLELNEEPIFGRYVDIPRIAAIVESMVKDSLDAFLAGDCELAQRVMERDDEVDKLNREIFRELLSYMAEDPHAINRGARILFISKNLERIADHAKNVAEMVVFMVKGKTIRHMDKSKQ